MAAYTITGGTALSPLTPYNIPAAIRTTIYGNLVMIATGNTLTIGDGTTPTFFDDSGFVVLLQYNSHIRMGGGATWTSGKSKNGYNAIPGRWMMGYGTSLEVNNANVTLDWRGLKLIWQDGSQSNSYLGLLNVHSSSYVDVIQSGENANTGCKCVYKLTGIVYGSLTLDNTILRSDSSLSQFDKLSMNGLTTTTEDIVQLYGNTILLTVDGFSPKSPITRIGSNYGGETNLAQKNFTLNNPFLDPANILLAGTNMYLHINTDVSLNIDVPANIAYTAGVKSITASATSDFTIDDIWLGIKTTPVASDGYIVPDTIEDSRTVKFYVGKYGYEKQEFTEFVDCQGAFNKSIFMKPFDQYTLTEVEALALTGVVIIYNENYAENGLLWNYTLDCGGNTVSDTHDFLYAIQLSSSTYFGKMGFEWWRMLERDGEGYLTRAKDGNGVRVINYGGNVTTMQSNSGEVFVPVQYANLTFTNLQSGSEVRIYEVIDEVDEFNVATGNTTLFSLGGTETSGISYTYAYNWSGDKNIIARIYHLSWNPLKIEAVLTQNGGVIPVSQVVDRNYYNIPAPVLFNNVFSTTKDVAVIFTVAELLAGSTYDGNVYDTSEFVSLTVTSAPTNGAFVDNFNGTYTYTPTTGYLGGDTLTYIPTYNVTYPGVTTNGKITFDVHVNQGAKYNNLIIFGDSINSRNFSDGYQADSFMARHLEIYGSPIVVANEAISGYTTSKVDEDTTTFLDKHTDKNGDAIVWISVATNDIYAVREAKIIDPSYNHEPTLQTSVYDKLESIRDKVLARSMKFAIGQQTFLKFDTLDNATTVYDQDTNTFPFNPTLTSTLNEDVFGSAIFNENATYGINKACATFTSEFALANGVPMDQIYALTREDRYGGFEDGVHPNYYGRYRAQKAVLDSICLYNQYGMKPVEFDTRLGIPEVFAVFSGGIDVVADRYGRTPNNVNYGTSVPTAWLDKNGAASGITLDISVTGTYSVVNSNITGSDALVEDAWVDSEWQSKTLRLDAGSKLTLTFGGLTQGKAYKVHVQGYTDTNNGVSSINVCKNPTLNKTIERECLNSHYRFSDFTLLPQGTTDSITVEPKDGGYAYINVVSFYLLSNGQV